MNIHDTYFSNKCDVCGCTDKLTFVRASEYGPISFEYCKDCIQKNLEPYYAVVSYIASAGHFPQDINEIFVSDVRRMLPLWGKTEQQFIKDVDEAIAEDIRYYSDGNQT